MPSWRSVKAVFQGGSTRITLPATWVKASNLKHGDDVQILEHGVLIIFPPSMPDDATMAKIIEDLKGAVLGLRFLQKRSPPKN